MAHISNMAGFGRIQSADEKRKTILAAISEITADLDKGHISESVAFEILCSEISNLTGLPVEAGPRRPSS